MNKISCIVVSLNIAYVFMHVYICMYFRSEKRKRYEFFMQIVLEKCSFDSNNNKKHCVVAIFFMIFYVNEQPDTRSGYLSHRIINIFLITFLSHRCFIISIFSDISFYFFILDDSALLLFCGGNFAVFFFFFFINFNFSQHTNRNQDY
jgi:hypothetical protein